MVLIGETGSLGKRVFLGTDSHTISPTLHTLIGHHCWHIYCNSLLCSNIPCLKAPESEHFVIITGSLEEQATFVLAAFRLLIHSTKRHICEIG